MGIIQSVGNKLKDAGDSVGKTVKNSTGFDVSELVNPAKNLKALDKKATEFDDYLKDKEDELLSVGVAAVGVALVIMSGGAATPLLAAAYVAGGAALVGQGASMYGQNKASDDQVREAKKEKRNYEENTYVYGHNLAGQGVDGYNDINWDNAYSYDSIQTAPTYSKPENRPSMRPQASPTQSSQYTEQALNAQSNLPVSADEMQRNYR